jgi:hypothetical protein
LSARRDDEARLLAPHRDAVGAEGLAEVSADAFDGPMIARRVGRHAQGPPSALQAAHRHGMSGAPSP